MALNDLDLLDGDILPIESLDEAQQAYQGARTRMETEHVYDAEGRIVHPAPRWATATAYLGVHGLEGRSGEIEIRWAIGFARDPYIAGTGLIQWEIEARGPQIVQVGVEILAATMPFDWERDVALEASGSGGQGRVLFHAYGGGIEAQRLQFVAGIRGLLIVVRAM